MATEIGNMVTVTEMVTDQARARALAALYLGAPDAGG